MNRCSNVVNATKLDYSMTKNVENSYSYAYSLFIHDIINADEINAV